MIGGGGRDRLRGGGGDDDCFGRSGDDLLFGGPGSDDLNGGGGRDHMRGGGGDDDFIGGAGVDIMIGGAGEDNFILQVRGKDIIRDFEDGIDDLGTSGGLSFNDLLISQQGNNTLIRAFGVRIALLVGVNARSISAADFDD